MEARRLAVLICTLISAACSEAGAGGTASISPHVLLDRIQTGHAPVILDVRTPEEYARGHVPGAINIPHTELPARIAELAPERDGDIVVYCEQGGRAVRAESILREARFSQIEHLEGDMSGWRAGRLPCEGC